MRTLFFDIETGAGVNGFKSDLSVALCIGYKFSDEKTVHCLSILDHGDPTKKSIHLWDKEMLKEFSLIIAQADLLVGHYSKGFDKKYLNGRMLLHKLPPHPPIKHIDTCFEARSIAAFSSNRLGHLSKILNLHNKKKSNGWPEWWMEVGRNPHKKIKEMIPYCKGDVLATESLYLSLLPFMRNKGIRQDTTEERSCPKCGCNNVHIKGKHVNSTSIRRRLQCQGCGAWCLGEILEKNTNQLKDI